MEVIDTALPDIKLLVPKKFGDHRGFFSETYNMETLRKAGIAETFVQDNQSLSVEKGVLRGLHYQVAPKAQGKLVRVLKGAVLDVAVDVRRGSPTFGQVVKEVLSEKNWRQIWVPVGFAHGFVTLEPNTEVIYKVTNLYSPEHERGILWNDPELGIDWQLDGIEPILSDRDKVHPPLASATDLL